MNIIIGSNNRAKIKAVKTVFTSSEVIPLLSPSNVSPQPLTEKETQQGAINRAYYCAKKMPQSLCIGLEGGVTIIDHTLYLCSWGALVVSGELYTAGGSNIPLPNDFIEPLQNGVELGELMESYSQLSDVRHQEGAVGIFTNGVISRSDLFVHIVKLLKGQMDYSLKNKL